MKSLAILALCAMMMASSVSANQLCVMCDVLTTYVDAKLKANGTEEAIKARAKAVCLVMPPGTREQCKEAINSVFQHIEAWTPKEICVRLHLCAEKASAGKSVQNTVQNTVQNAVQETVQGTEECAVCKMVFTMVDQKLSQNRTVTEVEHVLDEICDKLPQAVSSECTTLVSKYGPIAVKYLVAHAEPEEICTELRLCSAAKSGRNHHMH